MSHTLIPMPLFPRASEVGLSQLTGTRIQQGFNTDSGARGRLSHFLLHYECLLHRSVHLHAEQERALAASHSSMRNQATSGLRSRHFAPAWAVDSGSGFASHTWQGLWLEH